MIYRIRPAERRDLPALAQLADAQAAARRALDPRLPGGAHVIPFLSNAHTLGDVLAWRHHATFVAERDGVVVGGINLHPIEQKDNDQFAAYYPRRFTSIGLLATRADAPPTALPDLLTTACAQAARWKTPSLLLHNASADRALHDALSAFGFRAYYQYALRTPENLTPRPPLLSDAVPTGEGESLSIAVRRATRRDLDDVVRIGMDSVRYHAMFEHTMQIPRNEHKKMRQRFEATLAASNVSTLFVAEAQGRVAGFYSIYIQSIDDTWTPPLFVAGRYGLIAEVAVDKNVRGHGIGRQLFAAAEHWFRERSAFCIWLIYLPHNPLSSKFWPALGFVPVWEVLLREA